MSQPNKSTPATKTASKAAPAKAAAKPVFSFSGLSFDDAPAPVRASGKTATPIPDSVKKVIAASWAERTQIPNRPGRFRGAGKRVTVPTDQASTVANVLRRAARELGQGLGLRSEENGVNTTLLFAVQSPKESKKNSAPAAPVTPATSK
jgi:hypothetical protein